MIGKLSYGPAVVEGDVLLRPQQPQIPGHRGRKPFNGVCVLPNLLDVDALIREFQASNISTVTEENAAATIAAAKVEGKFVKTVIEMYKARGEKIHPSPLNSQVINAKTTVEDKPIQQSNGSSQVESVQTLKTPEDKENRSDDKVKITKPPNSSFDQDNRVSDPEGCYDEDMEMSLQIEGANPQPEARQKSREKKSLKKILSLFQKKKNMEKSVNDRKVSWLWPRNSQRSTWSPNLEFRKKSNYAIDPSILSTSASSVENLTDYDYQRSRLTFRTFRPRNYSPRDDTGKSERPADEFPREKLTNGKNMSFYASTDLLSPDYDHDLSAASLHFSLQEKRSASLPRLLPQRPFKRSYSRQDIPRIFSGEVNKFDENPDEKLDAKETRLKCSESLDSCVPSSSSQGEEQRPFYLAGSSASSSASSSTSSSARNYFITSTSRLFKGGRRSVAAVAK